MSLRQQRCVLHPEREAVARCPECGRFFCRECVTEHEGRLLCAACIGRLVVPCGVAPARGRWAAAVVRRVGVAVAVVCSAAVLVGFYLLVAVALSSVPHRFHDSSAVGAFAAGEGD